MSRSSERRCCLFTEQWHKPDIRVFPSSACQINDAQIHTLTSQNQLNKSFMNFFFFYLIANYVKSYILHLLSIFFKFVFKL